MQNRLIVDVVKKPIELEKLSQKIKETIVN
jgi:hypothetical protein